MPDVHRVQALFLSAAIFAFACGGSKAATLPATAMSADQRSQRPGGHLYMQTNDVQNSVVHYRRAPDGTITEVERVRTGGSGVGPDGPFFVTQGAKGILLTPDGRFLIAVNPGDNSVSSFAVGADGKLTLVDRKETGNIVTGKSGTAKSLAYSAKSSTLYVLHSFGPDHLRLMSVDHDGRLTVRPERYSVVPKDKPKRLSTMVVLSPGEKFLLVAASLDELPAANPDGTPIPGSRGTVDRTRSLPTPPTPTVWPFSQSAKTALWATPCSKTPEALRHGTRCS